MLQQLLANLKPKERRVLEMRYVLLDGTPQSLAEIGRRFRLTLERIRQIEAQALRRMRHPCQLNKLKGFLAA